MALQFVQRDLHGVWLFELAGKLDKRSARELEKPLLESVSSGGRSLLLDFSQLDQIDGDGLRMLVRVDGRLRAYGARFAFAGLRSEVKQVLARTRLSNRLPIHDTQAEALSWLEKSVRVARIAELAGSLLRKTTSGPSSKMMARAHLDPRRLDLAVRLLGLTVPKGVD